MKKVSLLIFVFTFFSCENKDLSFISKEISASNFSNNKEKIETYLEKIAKFYPKFIPVDCAETSLQLDWDKYRLNQIKGTVSDTTVRLDYTEKDFSFDRYKLATFLLEAWDWNFDNSSEGFIFAELGIEKKIDLIDKKCHFENFNIKIFALDDKYNKIEKIKPLILLNYSSSPENLKELYKFLNDKRLLGFDPSLNKNGVVYKITDCISWVSKNKASKYYFYPAFRGKFTTIIISKFENLRILNCDEINQDSYDEGSFAGDKGQSCCPPESKK